MNDAFTPVASVLPGVVLPAKTEVVFCAYVNVVINKVKTFNKTFFIVVII